MRNHKAREHKTRVEGIYFNTSDSPVFLEGHSIGGHDYVYLEGFLRVPGHFILVQDPQDDPDAPETFREAYRKMMEKGQDEKKPTHANSRNDRSNVVPVEESESEEDTDQEEKPARPSKSTRARKGKSDSSSADESAQ